LITLDHHISQRKYLQLAIKFNYLELVPDLNDGRVKRVKPLGRLIAFVDQELNSLRCQREIAEQQLDQLTMLKEVGDEVSRQAS